MTNIIVREFDALNLEGNETVHPMIKVDNSTAAILARLRVNDLRPGDKLTIHSYNPQSFVSLEAVFRIRKGDVSVFEKKHHPEEEIIDVIAKVKGQELSKYDINWFQGPDAVWQIFIQRERNDQNSSLLNLNVSDPLFVSGSLQDLEADSSNSPPQIQVGRALLMAPNGSDEEYISVSEIGICQPKGAFRYVGEPPRLSVKCIVSADNNDELSDRLKENNEFVRAELISLNNSAQRASGESPVLDLEPGEECVARAKLRVKGLRDLLSEDTEPITVSWMIFRSNQSQNYGAQQSFDTQPPLSEIETKTRITMSRGEFICARLSGEQIFLHFARQAEDSASEILGRSFFQSMISVDAFRGANPTVFGLSFESLEKNLTQLSAKLSVSRDGAQVFGTTIKELNFSPRFEEQIEFVVNDNEWLAEVAEAIEDKDGCELWFNFTSIVNDTKYNAKLVVPIADAERKPILTFCLDYGASATSISVGKLGSNPIWFDLPLGAFAKTYYGEHAESLDGAGNLLPMTLELDPDANVRRRFDPHSYGNMKRAWPTDEATLSRLSYNDRIYDVTIDVTRSLHLSGGHIKESTSLSDLKSQVVSDDGTGLGPPMRQFKRKSSNNELETTKRPVLADLMRDTFAELADYFVPNALFMLKNSEEIEQIRSFYDIWLESSQNEMQIIQTYPSGLGGQQLEIFRAAGRKFAQRLLSDGTEMSSIADPIFVPEGLAAAYGALSKLEGELEAGTIFACVDIGASTVDAALVKVNNVTAEKALPQKDPWTVIAHFGQPVGGDDLDKAIVELVFQFLLKEFSPKNGQQSPFGFKLPYNLELTNAENESASDARRRERKEIMIRQELFKVVRAAKVKDSAETFMASEGLPYRWENLPSPSDIRLDLTEILEIELQSNNRQPAASQKKTGEEMFLAESGSATNRSIELHIPRSMLRTPSDDPKSPATPGDVAQLLGEAIPTMLIRAAAKNAGSTPTKLQWVVSGRGSLWPPIYENICATLSRANNTIKHIIDSSPAPANELKGRVIDGARKLFESGININSALPNPLAIIRQSANEEVTYGGRHVRPLEWVEYLSESHSERTLTEKSFQYLVISLPGLDDTIESGLMSTREIQILFARMFKGLHLFHDLAQLTNKRGSTSDCLVEWKHSPDDRLLSWNIGDGWNTTDAGGP